MADFNYVLTLADIGKGLVDLENDTIKVALCTADYVADRDVDHYLSSVLNATSPAGSAIISTVTLAGKSFTAGVFDADDVTFTAPAAGATVTQAIIYQDASPSSGARLIRKVSGTTVAGFPFTTSGGDVSLAWPNDSNKIFRFINA